MILNCFGIEKLHGFIMHSVMLAVGRISRKNYYSFKCWQLCNLYWLYFFPHFQHCYQYAIVINQYMTLVYMFGNGNKYPSICHHTHAHKHTQLLHYYYYVTLYLYISGIRISRETR